MTNGLKLLEEICTVDTRHKPTVRISASTGEAIPLQLADLHEAISEIALSGTTPPDIATHFDIARNLFLYSWFVFDFSTPAQAQAYASVEFAIKERLSAVGTPGKKHWGLKRLLREAIGRGWIKDGGFPRLRYQNDATPPSGGDRQDFDPEGTIYCKVMLDAMPHFRNDLAHGSSSLLGSGTSLRVLEVCAAIINQLFPPDIDASA